MRYSVLEQFVALSPPMSSSFESSHLELSDLFSSFKWHILIRIMSKTLFKIVPYNHRWSHHFSKGPLNPPNISLKETIPYIASMSPRKPKAKHKPSFPFPHPIIKQPINHHVTLNNLLRRNFCRTIRWCHTSLSQ